MTSAPNDVRLENKEYVVVSELESVLYPLSLLIQVLQTDRYGCLAYSYLYIFRTFVLYAIANSWWVVNVDREVVVDKEKHWHGSAKFPQRTYHGVPVGQGEPSLEAITLVKRMTRDPKKVPAKLIECIEKGFRTYWAKAKENKLLASACDLLRATIGLAELGVQ